MTDASEAFPLAEDRMTLVGDSHRLVSMIQSCNSSGVRAKFDKGQDLATALESPSALGAHPALGPRGTRGE